MNERPPYAHWPYQQVVIVSLSRVISLSDQQVPARLVELSEGSTDGSLICHRPFCCSRATPTTLYYLIQFIMCTTQFHGSAFSFIELYSTCFFFCFSFDTMTFSSIFNTIDACVSTEGTEASTSLQTDCGENCSLNRGKLFIKRCMNLE